MRTAVTGRLLALAALGAASMLLAPMACLFPSYTFDLGSTGGTGGAGAGSSSSSSASSSSSSGAGGTGGMMPGPEDCLNGVDDNDDGRIDCDDPQCQAAGYECVDPVPAGWEAPGYVALYEGATGQTPPACPTDMPTQVFTGNATLNVQPTTCTACGCTAPTGQDCLLSGDLDTSPSSPGIQAMQVRNVPCSNPAATHISTLTVPDPPWGGACYHDEMLPAGQLCSGLGCNASVQASLPSVAGGTCTATGGVAGKPMPKWAAAAAACHGTRQGAGCAGSQVCMPKPANPFKGHVCIEQPGDVACPAGSFSSKTVYFNDFDDTRGCTGCQCGPASGGSCEITLTLYSDQAANVCTTAVGTVKTGQCADLLGNPGIFGWTDQVSKQPSGGSCQPTAPSAPTGMVTPKGPTTFCCL